MVRIAKQLYRVLQSKIHHHFDPIGYARSIGVRVGDNCRLIGVNFGSEPYLVKLGDHVSITGSYFVTHDGGVWVFRDKIPEIDIIAPIEVGNNVFIGLGSIIMPGVKIGDNVIVGAGSIVTKSIESNSVVAGAPAKIIKKIDDYYEKIKNRNVGSAKLNRAEKKEFLLEYFNLKDS